jgi:hypothetical protein
VTQAKAIAESVWIAYERAKWHALIVVAKGARYNTAGLASYLEEHHDRLRLGARMTMLGHAQRLWPAALVSSIHSSSSDSRRCATSWAPAEITVRG